MAKDKENAQNAQKDLKPSVYPPWQLSQFGRPTKYHPDNCSVPIELGKQGKCTFAHVGAYFCISKETVAKWMRTYPDFAEAFKTGQTMTEAFLADHYMKQADERGIKMAQGFAAFHMKQHGWTDQVDHKHSGDVRIVVNRGIKQIEQQDDDSIEADYEDLDGERGEPSE